MIGITTHPPELVQCQGADQITAGCRCPQLAREITIEISSGITTRSRWVCSCCNLLFPLVDRRNPEPINLRHILDIP